MTFLVELSKQGVHLVYLAAIVALWRQMLKDRDKYEALVREMGATLAIVAKELDHEHDQPK